MQYDKTQTDISCWVKRIFGWDEKVCGHNVLGRFVVGRKIWGCISGIPFEHMYTLDTDKFTIRIIHSTLTIPIV